MTTIVTSETLRLVRLALYQLRQDVGVPESVAAAADDGSVVWTKCKDCFDQAFAEVLNAHNWTWKRGVVIPERTDEDDPPIPPTVLEAPDGWPEDVKNALVYATARELAVPVAGRVEDMKNVHSLYEQKIHDARVHDLDAELAAVTDPDMKEVLAAVCPTITTGGAALPMDLVAVTRRVEANREHARAEIMAAHNWSFCREEMWVATCLTGDVNYPFYVGITFQWAVGVLFGYIFGITLGWGLIGMWCAFFLDEGIRGLIFILRWRSKKWMNRSFVK